MLDEHEHVVMHLGSGPKFVRKAFHELVRHEKGEVGEMAEGLFEEKTKESLYVAARVGPMHTAAVYVNLFSLMQSGRVKAGERIAMFSYGSGAASSLFSVRVVVPKVGGPSREEVLEANKEKMSASEFSDEARGFVATFGRFWMAAEEARDGGGGSALRWRAWIIEEGAYMLSQRLLR